MHIGKKKIYLKTKEKLEIAKNLFKQNIDINIILKIANLSINEINDLKQD